MFYRIKFNAGCEEFTFELRKCKYTVLVKDLVQSIRKQFKIKHSSLLVFDDSMKRLCDTDTIYNGKLYIIKRVPP